MATNFEADLHRIKARCGQDVTQSQRLSWKCVIVLCCMAWGNLKCLAGQFPPAICRFIWNRWTSVAITPCEMDWKSSLHLNPSTYRLSITYGLLFSSDKLSMKHRTHPPPPHPISIRDVGLQTLKKETLSLWPLFSKQVACLNRSFLAVVLLIYISLFLKNYVQK